MTATIESLLDGFAAGKLTRRETAAALLALAMPSPARAAAPLTPRNINHVTLSVSDIPTSRAFYQKILNAQVTGQSDFECDLNLGSSFIALMKNTKPPGIDHFCVGVDNYDASRVTDSMAALGIATRRLDSLSGVKFKEGQIYVNDPDGVRVQFARPDYTGEMKK
jgi:catechol 2,3-dioxygenase-like lactoylglutathione lyase family enzyme